MGTKIRAWHLVLGLCTFMFGSFAHADSCTGNLHSTQVPLISPQSDSGTSANFTISEIKESFKVPNSPNCVALVEVKVSNAFLNDDPKASKDLTQTVPLIVLFDDQSKNPNVKVLNLINSGAAANCGTFELNTINSKKNQVIFQVKGSARPCSGGTAIKRIDKTFNIKDGKVTILTDHSAPVH